MAGALALAVEPPGVGVGSGAVPHRPRLALEGVDDLDQQVRRRVARCARPGAPASRRRAGRRRGPASGRRRGRGRAARAGTSRTTSSCSCVRLGVRSTCPCCLEPPDHLGDRARGHPGPQRESPGGRRPPPQDLLDHREPGQPEPEAVGQLVPVPAHRGRRAGRGRGRPAPPPRRCRAGAPIPIVTIMPWGAPSAGALRRTGRRRTRRSTAGRADRRTRSARPSPATRLRRTHVCSGPDAVPPQPRASVAARPSRRTRSARTTTSDRASPPAAPCDFSSSCATGPCSRPARAAARPDRGRRRGPRRDRASPARGRTGRCPCGPGGRSRSRRGARRSGRRRG